MEKSNSITFGYARVSTKEQNLDGQVDALINVGVNKDYLFKEKASGRVKDWRCYISGTVS